MSTKFNMTKDIAGYNGFGIMPSYDIQSSSLAANTAQSITVPSNYSNWIAIFSYTPGSNIWVSFTGTAALPTSSFGAHISVLNPSARAVKAGEVISFITGDSTTPFVSVEFQVIAPYVN
jgi:hypothetical protein